MMALAQHLRPDQRLGLLGAETGEDSDQLPFLTGRTAAEDIDDNRAQVAAEPLLRFVCAEADWWQRFAIAERASHRDRVAQDAVVGDEQSVAAMARHRLAAIAAAELVSTLAA